jgi:hypothetical protein
MKEMAKSTDVTARDVKLITKANQSQSAAAARLVDLLGDQVHESGNGSGRARRPRGRAASNPNGSGARATSHAKSGHGRAR